MILRAFLLLCLLVAPARADVLDKVAASGEIALGHRTDAPPFSHVEAGRPAGLAVRLCEAVAEEVSRAAGRPDLRIRWGPVTAADRFAALESGRIDMLCGPTTQTLARRERFDFSIPYFIDGMGAVFRAGPGAGFPALAGEVVGVLQGTTTAALIPEILAARGAAGAEIVGYESHVDGLEALAFGHVAAYFGDAAILRYQLGLLRPRTPLQFAPGQFSFEPYALTMRRGETRLRLLADAALSRAFRSGAVEAMIGETLGEVTLSDLVLSIYRVVTLPE